MAQSFFETAAEANEPALPGVRQRQNLHREISYGKRERRFDKQWSRIPGSARHNQRGKNLDQ